MRGPPEHGHLRWGHSTASEVRHVQGLSYVTGLRIPRLERRLYGLCRLSIRSIWPWRFIRGFPGLGVDEFELRRGRGNSLPSMAGVWVLVTNASA